MRRALLLLSVAIAAAAEPVDLANPDLDELSGLAVSRTDAQLLWGHNDTGGGAVLYRLGPAGENLGAVPVEGTRANDWEDIAAFEHAGAPALLIADTGDNLAARGEAVLYAVTDPGRRGQPMLLWRMAFRFPDGARDCEAVAVDPVGREILLVSKRDRPPRLYRLPLPESPPPDRLRAEFVGELGGLPASGLTQRLLNPFANAPTGLDISRDGGTAALLTLRHVHVFRRAAGASWAQAFARPAVSIELPPLNQAEAVALSADGRELIIGSEGRPGRLARFALPH